MRLYNKILFTKLYGFAKRQYKQIRWRIKEKFCHSMGIGDKFIASNNLRIVADDTYYGKSNLILDVGFHKCEDTDFYLSLGYDVVGIDADLINVKNARIRHYDQISSKQLILEHCAITKQDALVNFYHSESSGWSSLNKKIATRQDSFYIKNSVQGKPLSYFLKKYGIPYYCKIDIAGYDVVALESLEELSCLPKYISVETECIGDKDVLSEDEILITLMQLHKLGYNRFKLIDQVTMKQLLPNCPFYNTNNYVSDRMLLSQTFNYPFKMGASGLFGEFLDGAWLNYEDAISTILYHRKEFFSIGDKLNFTFWCDWHATKQ